MPESAKKALTRGLFPWGRPILSPNEYNARSVTA